ncbi:MAG TPA: hypothetical protein ENH06_00030, partial [bacterium]|nr:hypothetical protein [bacterium]
MSKNKIKVTSENIAKAYEILDIVPEVEKEEKVKKAIEIKEEEKVKKAIEMEKKKAPNSEVEKEDEGEVEKKDPKKEEEEEEEEGGEKKKVEKAKKENKIKKSKEIKKSFQDSINEKIQLLGLLNRDLSQKIEKAIKSVQKIETLTERVEKAITGVDDLIQKSFTVGENNIQKSINLIKEEVKGEVDENKERIEKSLDLIEKIDDRIEKIERTPLQRRSITKSFVKKEREDIQKIEEDRVLSLSKDKKEISNLLLQKSGFETNQSNDLYVNAVISFEASGVLNKAIMNDLSKTEKIKFTS